MEASGYCWPHNRRKTSPRAISPHRARRARLTESAVGQPPPHRGPSPFGPVGRSPTDGLADTPPTCGLPEPGALTGSKTGDAPVGPRPDQP